jgi:peptide/nickel transport system substrate-binding protein
MPRAATGSEGDATMDERKHVIESILESRGRGGRLTRRELMRAGLAVGSGVAATRVLQGWPVAAAAAPAPKRGGTVTWGMTSDPVALVPFGGISGSAFEITSFVYESLLAWDRSLKVIPALAESWQIPDDKTYVFKLRPGVKFHSGKTLDADDVKYSLDLQKTPPPPGVIQSFYPKIANVEVVDPMTVRLHMAEPDATVLGYLAWGRYSWIIPKGLYDRADLRTHADGTGPFKLVEYIPNDHTTLTRHTGYWNPQLPWLDGITMKVLQDEQARVAAIRSGAIDGSTVTTDSARLLAKDPSLTVLKGLTAVFREVELTIHGDGKPWNNLKVRQAINAAINRQEIIDKVYGGDALYSSKIPPGYGDWPIPDSALKSTYEKFDLAKAKQLMADAGMPNGFSVTLQSIAHPEDYTQVAEVLKEQLRQININVTVQPLEIGTFATNNGAGSFEWQSTGRGMRGDPSGFIADFDPQSALYKAWYAGGYKNQELTNLYYQALHEPHPVKRLPLYRRMQEIVLTEAPVLPIVNPMYYHVVRKRLNGMYVAYDATERGLIGAWIA